MISKANDIFIRYRLMEIPLDLDTLKKELNKNIDRNDFIQFFEQTLKMRWGKGIIKDGTKKNHQNTLNRLKQYDPKLKFTDFHPKWAEEYDAYLRNKCRLKNYNSRWSQHTVIKSYLNYAKAESIVFVNPYDFFKLKKVDGKWEALERLELKALLDFYNSIYITSPEKKALRMFLFSCFTGLRASDLENLHEDHVKEDRLALTPIKTERFDKQIEVPLNEFALKLLEEEREISVLGKLFRSFHRNTVNKKLKMIAKRIGINKRLHLHVGRETFATLLVDNNVQLPVIQELMGHSKITTTRKYIKINLEMKKRGGQQAGKSLTHPFGITLDVMGILLNIRYHDLRNNYQLLILCFGIFPVAFGVPSTQMVPGGGRTATGGQDQRTRGRRT
ncbi:site-specific integrase [Rapidithrix thailandica]|uniref:Site-specific integrase n=1 Tax=Rapidithrix thailandica TaxID=413964 RepID=A0AAW9S7Y1_9BACT